MNVAPTICQNLQDSAMHKIKWTERFSVGVSLLDAQHKQLIKLVNTMIDNEHSAPNSEIIADLLQRMTEYAAYHFATEERLLKHVNYPGYNLQQEEHTEFKARTASFCLDAIQHKPDLSRELLRYLSSWLTDHILHSDMQYKTFLAYANTTAASISSK